MTGPAPQKDKLSFLDFLASSVKARILPTLWESWGRSGLGMSILHYDAVRENGAIVSVFASGFVKYQEVLSQVFAIILLFFKSVERKHLNYIR